MPKRNLISEPSPYLAVDNAHFLHNPSGVGYWKYMQLSPWATHFKYHLYSTTLYILRKFSYCIFVSTNSVCAWIVASIYVGVLMPIPIMVKIIEFTIRFFIIVTILGYICTSFLLPHKQFKFSNLQTVIKF